MPNTVAVSSQGTLLKVSISSVMTSVTQVKALVGPSIITDYNEITTLSSPSAYKEFLPIMKDPGPVTFDLVFDSANAAQMYLQGANTNSTLESFQIITTHAVPKTIAFTAYVAKFEYSATTGQPWMVKVELKVTGAVTIT